MSDDRIEERVTDLLDGNTPEDVAFVGRLITSFLDRAPVMLVALRAAIDDGDATATAHHAHALKGAAANLGVNGVAAMCADAQHRAERAELDTLGEHPARIAAALDGATPRLRSYVTSTCR
jgi:HPt (histidine-containing phosphotransfer) domain-containing protein